MNSQEAGLALTPGSSAIQAPGISKTETWQNETKWNKVTTSQLSNKIPNSSILLPCAPRREFFLLQQTPLDIERLRELESGCEQHSHLCQLQVRSGPGAKSAVCSIENSKLLNFKKRRSSLNFSKNGKLFSSLLQNYSLETSHKHRCDWNSSKNKMKLSSGHPLLCPAIALSNLTNLIQTQIQNVQLRKPSLLRSALAIPALRAGATAKKRPMSTVGRALLGDSPTSNVPGLPIELWKSTVKLRSTDFFSTFGYLWLFLQISFQSCLSTSCPSTFEALLVVPEYGACSSYLIVQRPCNNLVQEPNQGPFLRPCNLLRWFFEHRFWN